MTALDCFDHAKDWWTLGWPPARFSLHLEFLDYHDVMMSNMEESHQSFSAHCQRVAGFVPRVLDRRLNAQEPLRSPRSYQSCWKSMVFAHLCLIVISLSVLAKHLKLVDLLMTMMITTEKCLKYTLSSLHPYSCKAMCNPETGGQCPTKNSQEFVDMSDSERTKKRTTLGTDEKKFTNLFTNVSPFARWTEWTLLAGGVLAFLPHIFWSTQPLAWGLTPF